MKPIRPQPPIPGAIIKRAAQVPQPCALFILLDAIPYCEIAERNPKEYELAFVNWRRSILNTLARSNVRYFVRNLDFGIVEVRP